MTVLVRPYTRRGGGGQWEIDLRVMVAGREVRERVKSPVSGFDASLRWGRNREVEILREGLSAIPEPQPTNVEIVEKKNPVTKPQVTVLEFSKRFLEAATSDGQSLRELEAKKSILRLHVLPHVGSLALDEVGPEHVSSLKTLYRAGYRIEGVVVRGTTSSKTIANRLVVLTKLLRVAHEWGERSSPAPKIGVKIRNNKTPGIFQPADLERLLAAAQKMSRFAYVALLLGAQAGLRSGEIQGLEWQDVDLRTARLRVERQLQRGKPVPPKGGKTRSVPLSTRLVEALSALPHREGRVLRVDHGAKTKVVSHEVIRVWLRNAEAEAGLSKTGCVHRLRHTFCSALAAKGVSVHVIKELAGHSDLKTTLRYLHLHDGAMADAVSRL